MDDTLARVATRVAERFPADLERIRDYLRMPSVSATGDGIGAAAEATGPWIEGAGGSFEASGGVGHAAGAHGPDEYATLAGLQEHIVGAAAFLLVDADLPR
jgi:hypothetical protein